MRKKNRDDFLLSTKNQIAKRAGWICSFPTCGKHTVGASSDGQSEINIGTAAHICAAAPGGPRYDATMSTEERSSANNGMWMCRDHGKIIDAHDPKFTVELLREWKKQAECASYERVINNESVARHSISDAELVDALRLAAEKDIDIFKKTTKWPSTSVALKLKVEGHKEPIDATSLAGVATMHDDLILVAPPGMGKTTTLFQIAEGVLAKNNCIPFMVSLGDWATENLTLLESILKRPAFNGISEDDLRKVATQTEIVLILDGWNEMGLAARQRARVQVEALKAELPELALVVSTRRQELDVPFAGLNASLLPLSREQQKEIAFKMGGVKAESLLAQAWLTAGLRELISIPLYLKTLLSLPEHEAFPTTKEEILSHFIAAQEKDLNHAESLKIIIHGFQQFYLEDLASFTTLSQNTSLSDTDARSVIFDTVTSLVESKQIITKPEPSEVLDALVSHHLLTRTGENASYSFQHQQFQEWYASHKVERRIMEELLCSQRRETFKSEVLNVRAWEEPLLFAIERLSKGNEQQRRSSADTILASLEVDPILAAEMIFRTTEEVWHEIAETIEDFTRHWHAPEHIDRAFRFMLTSGRPEFFDLVWPLITSDDEQTSLQAIRHCSQFRISILGSDPHERIMNLAAGPREVLLSEIASHGDMAGVQLVTTIACDAEPNVQALVASQLFWQRELSLLKILLERASDETFDIIIRRNYVDKIDDIEIDKRIESARERLAADDKSAYRRLHLILYARDYKDKEAELTEIISSMEIEDRPRGHSPETTLIYEVYRRFPRAVWYGLLTRLNEGRPLFYGAIDILASSDIIVDNNNLLQIVLEKPENKDDKANAAASIIGADTVSKMLDYTLDKAPQRRDTNGKYDEEIAELHRGMMSRINHVPLKSLIYAIQARSSGNDNEQITSLTEILLNYLAQNNHRSTLNETESSAIRALAIEWGERLMATGNAQRFQLHEIARLMSYVPDASLLKLLCSMLNVNLQRYDALRKEAQASGWTGNVSHEARMPMLDGYVSAFVAIDSLELIDYLKVYLNDNYFGHLAARVLVNQWIAKNESPQEKSYFRGINFDGVRERRTKLATHPDMTSDEAEVIFSSIEMLIVDGATDEQIKHAVKLGVTAARLPHGHHRETILRLIELSSWQERAELLQNLILSGMEVDVRFVSEGFHIMLEDAEKKPWIWNDSNGYQVRRWLELLPYTMSPSECLEIINFIPEAQYSPTIFNEMLSGLANSPSDGCEEVLFELAQRNSSFYQNHEWRESVLGLGTSSAAHKVIDLIIEGRFDSESNSLRPLEQALGKYISEYPHLRNYVYDVLGKESVPSSHQILVKALSYCLDMKGILLLVGLENSTQRRLFDWYALRDVIYERIPDQNWKEAYTLSPLPALELRQKLLAMTMDGGATDAAAGCLKTIDEIRDELGVPVSEPRHPDLGSGKPWPIIA